MIPRLEFRDAAVREAVGFLQKKVGDLDTTEPDPAQRGMSFVLKLPSTVGDLDEKRITLSLKNVGLMDALKYMAELTGCLMTIEPYALTILPKAQCSVRAQAHEKSEGVRLEDHRLGSLCHIQFGVTAMLSIHPRCSCGVRL